MKNVIIGLLVACIVVIGISSASNKMTASIEEMLSPDSIGIEKVEKVEEEINYRLLSVSDFSVGLHYIDNQNYASTSFILDEGLALADYSYLVVRYDFSSIAGFTFPNLSLDLMLANESSGTSVYSDFKNHNSFVMTGSEWYDSETGTGGDSYTYKIDVTSLFNTYSEPDILTFVYKVTEGKLETYNIYLDDQLITTDSTYAKLTDVDYTHLYGLKNAVNINTDYQVIFDGVELYAFNNEYDGDISRLFDVDGTAYTVTDLSSINDYSIINGQ